MLPDFTWSVSGNPLSIKIGTDEPFSGGNSMKGIYGAPDDANNLNVRIAANNVSAGQSIPHSANVRMIFNAATPASGWGFAVIDIDVDQVRIAAKDEQGVVVPAATIARWFVQRFDANPSQDGVNVPSWDPAAAAVVGSESRSKTYRTTVEGGLVDTEAGSAWFQPNVSLTELSFDYQSLQSEATPSFHILVAGCSTTFVAPTPTPAPAGDSDLDGIPDVVEGSGDVDNDDIPNYLDRDSDNDTILDADEGNSDADNDQLPDRTDADADGDDVADRVERDPLAPVVTPSNQDSDRDGIDDGERDRTHEPIVDRDSDGSSDTTDTDSDNDGKDDGDEAYDLDGDGDRDVQPSGEDADGDGIDDAFVEFDTPSELNPEFSGGTSSPPPCDDLNAAAKKAKVSERLTALYARVNRFSQGTAACGALFPTALVNAAEAARRSFNRILSRSFQDTEILCDIGVCERLSRRDAKRKLRRLADQIGRQAKQAKLGAMRACGDTGHRGGKPETRPKTDSYVIWLQRAIARLPNNVTRCGS